LIATGAKYRKKSYITISQYGFEMDRYRNQKN